ncbi:MAG TPA: hypothetical protein VFJ16_31250 [Longimicrobium sp.]|nr:hypothetical protein [Longimicrobium sp.]
MTQKNAARKFRQTLRRLIRRARAICPGFGCREIGAADLWILLEAANLSVDHAEIVPAAIIGPRIEGGRCLTLRIGLPGNACLFAVLYEVACAWIGGVKPDRFTAEVFATIGVRPHVGHAHEDDLAALDEEWYTTMWARERACAVSELALFEGSACPVGLPARELYELGRTARGRSDYEAARTLLGLAVRRGKVDRDWLTVSRALTASGTLLYREGNMTAARRQLSSALSCIRQHKIVTQLPFTLHDAFVFEALAGRDARALRFAESALSSYDREDPRWPLFAHDVGWYLLDRALYLPAFKVLRYVLSAVLDRGDRMRALSNFAIVASAVGDVRQYDSTCAELNTMIAAASNSDAVPRAYLGLAEGALHLSLWRRAFMLAECAFVEADARGQADVRAQAEALLRAAEEQRLPEKIRKPFGNTMRARWERLVTSVAVAVPATRALGASA